jgi:hypothetical protein
LKWNGISKLYFQPKTGNLIKTQPEQKVLTFIVISFLDKKKNYKKLTKNSKRAIVYSGPDSGKDIFDNSIHVWRKCFSSQNCWAQKSSYDNDNNGAIKMTVYVYMVIEMFSFLAGICLKTNKFKLLLSFYFLQKDRL